MNQRAGSRTKKEEEEKRERENNLGSKKWRITAKLFIITTQQVVGKLLLPPWNNLV